MAARKIVRRSCLGARPRYNLVVDEDVKKPNKQTNNLGLVISLLQSLPPFTSLYLPQSLWACLYVREQFVSVSLSHHYFSYIPFLHTPSRFLFLSFPPTTPPTSSFFCLTYSVSQLICFLFCLLPPLVDGCDISHNLCSLALSLSVSLHISLPLYGSLSLYFSSPSLPLCSSSSQFFINLSLLISIS